MSAPKAGSQAANLLHKAVVGGLMLGTAIVLIDFTGIAGKIVYRRKIQGISAMDDIQAAEAAKEAESQAAATSAEASSATAAEASSATPAPAPAPLATIGTALPHTHTHTHHLHTHMRGKLTLLLIVTGNLQEDSA